MLQGDHVALLSAFAEMGLRLRLDVPEQAMEVSTLFFRTSAPANEAFVSLHSLSGCLFVSSMSCIFMISFSSGNCEKFV